MSMNESQQPDWDPKSKVVIGDQRAAYDAMRRHCRTTTRELEIQGRTIPKGDIVTLMWIAANRDPRMFEDPDPVNIERDTEASLVWGRGIHLCMGAPLARLEMRVVLEELLACTTCIELVGAPPHRAVYPGDGLAALSLRIKGKPNSSSDRA